MKLFCNFINVYESEYQGSNLGSIALQATALPLSYTRETTAAGIEPALGNPINVF